MRVDIARSGGIAGVALTASIDTATLAGADRAAMERQLLGLPFDAPNTAPPHPDAFVFDVTIVDGATRRHARVAESDLTPALRAWIGSALRLPG